MGLHSYTKNPQLPANIKYCLCHKWKSVVINCHLQFFLELLYYSKSVVEEGVVPMPVDAVQQLRRADTEFRNEEGSVFETAASAFSSLVEDMESKLAAEVLGMAKVACRKYRAERCVPTVLAGAAA